MRFVMNAGQADRAVKYFEKGYGHATYFTDNGAYINLLKLDNKNNLNKGDALSKPGIKGSPVIRLSFDGNRGKAEIVPENPSPARYNYFRGKDQSKWTKGTHAYGSILYREVYSGVDVRFYGNGSQLEYDVIVKKGANPGDVRFSYEGIKSLKAGTDGSLDIEIEGGRISQKKPFIYQVIDGKRVEVEGGFKIISSSGGRHTYGFAVASYDRTRDLIIDPALDYSTYLGGNLDDATAAVGTDPSGNVYVAGYTASTDFPATNGSTGGGADIDAFLAKLDPSGNLVYSTYLGGTLNDMVSALAVDPSGAVYVTGTTLSTDFPTSVGAFKGAFSGGVNDAFVAKMDANGSLVYSTYLGGALSDIATGMAEDAAGNIHVVGYTASTDFPTTANAYRNTFAGGNYEAFVTGLSASGSLLYSTYIGGSADDYAASVSADALGNIHVAGYTLSADFPVTSNAIRAVNSGNNDSFVFRMDSAGRTLMYSTYLGGGGDDFAYSVSSDSSGNSYVAGATGSADFPAGNAFGGGVNDAFAAKIDNGGNLAYSVLLGGGLDDQAYGITTDPSGNAYVAGFTSSTDFPATPDAFSRANAGAYDSFILKLNSTGSLLYSSYLGGRLYDLAYAVARDSRGNVYLSGYTTSTDFPVVRGLKLTHSSPLLCNSYLNGICVSYRQGNDAFVSRIRFNTPPVLSYGAQTGYASGLSPASGTGSTFFNFKAVYADADGDAPSSVSVCVDGACRRMVPDAAAQDPTLKDGNYKNGEQYAYSAQLGAGAHAYYFTASDGTTSAALPAGAAVNGPAVSDLAITSPLSLSFGTQNSSYSFTLAASGGTGPYTWSVPTGLPAGLSLDTSTGVISGTPVTSGVSSFTVNVTDANGNVFSGQVTLNISADVTPPVVTPTVAGGTYVSSRNVLLTTDEPATVYCTTDRSTPTASSPVCAAPIPVNGSTTVSYFAVDRAGNASPVQTASYVITGGAPGAAGMNAFGQLGNGTTVDSPSHVLASGGIVDVSAVSAGMNHSTALTIGGTVWAWGQNTYGQLGADPAGIPSSLTPFKIGNLEGVFSISNGSAHGVALKGDGTVWTWGYNSSGQLGDGTTASRFTPAQVSITNVAAISGGYVHTLALKKDGTVWAWGSNASGQLGDGSTVSSATPLQVLTGPGTPLKDIIAVSAGAFHSAALGADGTVWTWGVNSSGQLGDGGQQNRAYPAPVVTLAGMTAVSAGYAHTLALKGDGTVWAWGANASGQLGDGTIVSKPSPVQVSGLTGVAAISAGYNHGIAVGSDKTVWAWGSNANGQLGDGTLTDRTTPVQSRGILADYAGAGAGHTVALLGSKTVDMSPPSGVVRVNGGAMAVNNTNITLNLALTDPSGLSMMRFSNDNITWTPWEAFNAAKAWAIPAGDGPKTVYVMASDRAGNTGSYPVTVTMDTVAPQIAVSPGGGTYTAQQNVTITSSEPGTVYYTLDGSSPVTSPSRKVYSTPLALTSNTTLNFFAVDLAGNGSAVRTEVYAISLPAAGGADLTVSAISAPATAQTGTNVTVANTVTNQGTVLATISTVKFYLSTEPTVNATAVLLGQRSVELGAGASSAVSTPLALPSTVLPGTYYAVAVADAGGVVAETNENNNSGATQAMAVSSGYDLSISAVLVSPTAISAGQKIAVTATVANGKAATARMVPVDFYLVTLSTNAYLGRATVETVTGGGSKAVEGAFVIPVGTPAGGASVKAVVDPGNIFIESNEANNTRQSANFTVR